MISVNHANLEYVPVLISIVRMFVNISINVSGADIPDN